MKLTALAGILLFFGLNGNAQQDSAAPVKKIAPWYVERFKVSAGFFVPVNNTSLQVGITGGDPGTEVDLEKDLGFNDVVGTFLANFQWNISRKSRINFSYFTINRHSTHVLEKDINFGDKTYYINSTVNSFFNTAIYQISYGYAIISKPKYEAGVLIGTHLVGGKTGISLDGAVTGIATSSDFGFTAPLPDLGLWGSFALSNRLAANLSVDYLSLTVDGTYGSIFAYSLLFTYRLVKKLDLSLGYSGLNFEVSTTKKNLSGEFRWGYNGPALGLSFSFGKNNWGP